MYVVMGLQTSQKLSPPAGRVEAVNPWELEVDPDFERTEDEIKRDQEAEQRALRAAALAMRR